MEGLPCAAAEESLRDWSEDIHEVGTKEAAATVLQGLTRNLGIRRSLLPDRVRFPWPNQILQIQGQASPPTVISKSSLLHRAVLHPPSPLIRPDLQMSASFWLSQHKCHIEDAATGKTSLTLLAGFQSLLLGLDLTSLLFCKLNPLP